MTWLSELEDFIIKKKKKKGKKTRKRKRPGSYGTTGTCKKIENATKTNKFLNYIGLYKF
jgi:hypothetical protein